MSIDDSAERGTPALEPSEIPLEEPAGSGAPLEEPPVRPDEPEGEGAEEGVSAAAGPPPEPPREPAAAGGGERDERRLLVIAGCAAGFLLLVTLLLFWQARRDVASLRDEVATLRVQARRSELLQQQATLLRVRGDLQGLRQTLPADLALEVDKADGVLAGVGDRLRAAR